MLTGGLPAGYSITGAATCLPADLTNGNPISCTVTGPSGQSATAAVLCSN
jgi:hypothetical protein